MDSKKQAVEKLIQKARVRMSISETWLLTSMHWSSTSSAMKVTCAVHRISLEHHRAVSQIGQLTCVFWSLIRALTNLTRSAVLKQAREKEEVREREERGRKGKEMSADHDTA